MKFDEKLTFDEKLIVRKNRAKTIFYSKIISIFVVFALVILYFFAPISQVGSYKLSGNYYFTSDEILESAQLSRKKSLYLVKTKEIEQSLKRNPLIKDCDVKCSVFGLRITISEICPVFYFDNGLPDIPYYTNEGELMNKDWLSLSSTSQHLNGIINSDVQNIFKVEFNPAEMEKNRIKKLSNIMLGLPHDETRNYVSFIGEENYYYYIYLHRGDDPFYLRINLPDILSDDPHVYSEALAKKNIDIYYDIVDKHETYKVNLRTFDDGKTRTYNNFFSLKIHYSQDNENYKVRLDNGSTDDEDIISTSNSQTQNI